MIKELYICDVCEETIESSIINNFQGVPSYWWDIRRTCPSGHVTRKLLCAKCIDRNRHAELEHWDAH